MKTFIYSENLLELKITNREAFNIIKATRPVLRKDFGTLDWYPPYGTYKYDPSREQRILSVGKPRRLTPRERAFTKRDCGHFCAFGREVRLGLRHRTRH